MFIELAVAEKQLQRFNPITQIDLTNWGSVQDLKSFSESDF